ncbi:methylated-DNA--[protein]-cysteine S-methyltransferase [Egibacter rhizosphaerae]|uniref:Methylated-DNA--protein-cysteine methyltransferase n=1 Tax=Egibacter rhizosphaerae TaxID=1670831 RepID=A0A411YD20_9ACTN|nr:methylated-DNA--[protein]-cysteine S-methyltransferase [Egibacter rhizosphaerae]QBI19075.1 methylated-DNA--[protein]-cysteine S-methyltransferase [Egibacter rhizosphaerae]
MTVTRYAWLDSPVGRVLATARDDGALVGLGLPGRASVGDGWRHDEEAFARLAGWLAAYAEGAPPALDLALAPDGTRFQREVWAALEKLPFGTTTSYGALAAAIGRPRAVRAVARAVGANPLPIIVPCHRVVGADGSLTGYAGGLDAKQRLLRLEGASLATI